MKRISTLSAILAVIVAIGCGGERGATGDGAEPLVIAFDSSPTNLDARIGNDQNSGRIFDLAYAGLVKLAPDGTYLPDVAESWEIADQRIEFKIRPGLKFHDGSDLTAADVKYTYDTVMDPEFPGAKGPGYAVVDSVEAPDESTIVFNLDSINAGIFDNLTLGIVPEGSQPDDLATRPVGAGPYQVTSFRRDDRVELEAFDQFWGDQPGIENLIVRVIPDATTRSLELQTGSIDFAINTIPFDRVPSFQESDEFKVIAEPGAQYQYLAFNLRTPQLAKVEVRRAIAHAIDRDRIIRDLLQGFGKATETLFPEGHWAHADDLPTYAFDPARAKQLLDQAGYPDPDGDGPQTRFNLVYKTSTDPEARRQAEMIQQMLSQVGIGIEIQSNEFGTFFEDVQAGKYDMFSLRRAGVNDPDFYTYMFASDNFPPAGQNRGYYANSRVDQLLNEGRSTWDQEERIEIYKEIQQILAEELPYVSLYHRYNVAIMKSDLEGFQMYPSGFILSVPEMHR